VIFIKRQNNLLALSRKNGRTVIEMDLHMTKYAQTVVAKR
jgi:hypothetical protein